ncbi:hypothetical protein GOP47_0019520 [Adiantum capillus-veneris]|uniref:DRBM domain-containing protein n=1 Tax=Adiantum capillus-veneris TaxID=13818 RepID=A0A9D4Z8J6_ADICA|nr:hypothetical protein GOP47_0019520 [Adiantum capillus-veneris]
MFKSQLQEYAHKAGWSAPVYDITREGPSHEPRFKAVVTVQNEAFESPAFYGNLKKAEHAAAEVALMAFSARPELQKPFSNPLHESGLCKNLLQEYAQKSKLPIPVYTLTKSGETHSPMFTATVKIDGVLYKGGLSKNKKEAEIKAAKTALLAICAERGGTMEQAFDNHLAALGQEAPAPPVAVVFTPPSTGVKRKKVIFGSLASSSKWSWNGSLYAKFDWRRVREDSRSHWRN